MSKDRFAWALQLAHSKHPGWDWGLEVSDFGATVKMAGRRGVAMTHIVMLAEYPSSSGYSAASLPIAIEWAMRDVD